MRKERCSASPESLGSCPVYERTAGPTFCRVLPNGGLQCLVYFQLQLRLKSSSSEQCPDRSSFSLACGS